MLKSILKFKKKYLLSQDFPTCFNGDIADCIPMLFSTGETGWDNLAHFIQRRINTCF